MCGRAVALASEVLVGSELAIMNSKREVLELWCIVRTSIMCSAGVKT